MKVLSILFLLNLMATAIFLPGQATDRKYGWPLAIRNGISSTFQEFRSNHFHAGIDLRTFQRTGFPVLAVCDGVIERVSMFYLGYGRSLQLRHADGNRSIYGHLEKFRPDLEAIVAKVQASRGEKYFGTYVLPDPVPVRRGEVIAYSGESGSGFPHLHLEIRDASGQALNPLMLLEDPMPDENEPDLRGILLRSRGGSLVNGDCGEFYFKLRKSGGEYTLSEPLAVSGSCDITLDAIDLSDVRHAVAPFSLEASLDGRAIFRTVFDRFSRDDNNQLGMLYDMSYSTPAGYFFNLSNQSGFSLEKTGVRLADELLRLLPGLHELRIEVRDQQQNQALALIPILKVPDGDERASGRRHAAGRGWEGRMNGKEFSTFVNHDDVVVKIHGFPPPATELKMKVVQGDMELEVPAREYADGLLFCFKPLNHELHLRLRFELSENGRAVEVSQKTLQAVLLQNQFPQTVRFHDFAAEFGSASVREPTVLLLDQAALEPDYPLLAGPVMSAPDHFAFLDAVIFKFKVPSGEGRGEQLGIFKYRPLARKWTYVPTWPDRESGYLDCRVLTAGTYALLRDIYPPAIRLRRPRSTHLDKLKSVVIRMSDKGKGIAEKTLAVFLNGRRIEAEYDPDWEHVRLEDLSLFRKGKNDLLVRVADLAGNGSEKRFTLSLK
jgi:hypothetical protein